PDDLPEIDPATRPESYESYHCAMQLSQLIRRIAGKFTNTRPASVIVLNRASMRIVLKIARAAPDRPAASVAFAKNRARAMGAARAVSAKLKSFHEDDPSDAQVIAA